MHLGDKLKLYRKKRDLDQPQMATIVGVSYRTYQEIERTGIIKKSKDIEAIKKILSEKEQIITSENTQKLEDVLPVGDLRVTLQDYLNEVRQQKEFLQQLLMDKIGKLDANLSTALGGVIQLSLHVESAREVVLKSLARLEKKPQSSLTDEADKIVIQLMKEHEKQHSSSGDRR